MTSKCPLCQTLNHPSREWHTLIYSCKTCQLIYLGDLEPDHAYYRNYYTKFRNGRNNANELRDQQYKLDAIHFKRHLSQGRILDIGCSTGGFTNAVDPLGEFMFTGIDIDESAIREAQKKYTKDNFKFEFSDLISFQDVAYDALVFRGTFQYLGATLVPAMEKVKKLLKKDGKLFIYSLPNSDSFLFYILKEKWHLFHPEHKLIFNRKCIEYLCQQFSFEILELSFPYVETVYADLKKDYETVKKILEDGNQSTSFWGNLLQVVLINK